MKIWKYFMLVVINFVVVEVHAGPCPAAERYISRENGTVTITDPTAYDAARRECDEAATRQRYQNMLQTNAPTAEESNSTRAAVGECTEASVSKGVLRICSLAPNSRGEVAKVYYLNGVEYNGLVVQEGSGYRLYDADEITQFTDEEARGTTIREQETQGAVNCGNPQRRSKYQCLVCNCFHEARGQTFDEQVMVNRVVLSRVLSPSHPSNACDVVYERAQFSWTSESQLDANDRNSIAKRDIVLDENSSQFNQYYPNDKNALRSCRRSSLESLKYEDEFFAAYYVEKTTNTPPWLKTCKERSRNGEIAVTPEENRISRDNLAHNFYKICERREGRCLMYPTCSLAPRTSPRPIPRPPGVSNRAIE